MHKTLYNSRHVANTKCSKHQGNTTQVSSSGSSSLSSSSTFISSSPLFPSSSSSSSCPLLTNIPSSFFSKPILLKVYLRVMGFDRGFWERESID
ncbi:hypothetical protein M9H77_18711 [Catharanthus roseus]|uniref:Uncharacterized protein n=1 Tax=Catharanthus roseus TaxID=4058 RepID=A0ACC0B8I4_CATRO|nr:hypothetical protein M9H77_18711 [Catharanthus roseus]